jgi:hypothetical protein
MTRSRGGITTRPASRTDASTRPDPARLATLAVTAWLEVAAGRRSLRQLEPILSPALAMRLTARMGSPSTCARAPATRSAPLARLATCQRPHDSACEAVVLVDVGGRQSAVAVRLEVHAGSWRVVGWAPGRSR